MKPRLQDIFETQILPTLASELGRTNVHSLPKLEKVVINMGVGAATQDKKFVEEAAEALTSLSGQKCVVTRARTSIAGFKLREGQAIGCKVTLRKGRMYEFIDRLISFALPRVRDFRGVSATAFDGHGNYSLGLSEQMVFPEINADKAMRIQGMNIVFVTTTDSDAEAKRLLELLGMPFKTDSKSADAA